MKGYIVDVEFIWGFQCRIAGLSKTSPSFLYPPPTTFLGALAESIAKREAIGEEKGKQLISALCKNLLALGVRPLNAIPVKYEDLNRIIAVKITGGKYYPRVDNLIASFDSPARGKTILSSIDGEPPRLRFFIVVKSTMPEIDNEKIEITSEHFWSIHRIGSKESRISVINVEEISDLETKINTRIITNYSFPLFSSIRPMRPIQIKWNAEVYIDPFKIEEYKPLEYVKGKKLLPFMVPILVRSPPEYIVELKKDAQAFSYKKEVVIGCSA